MADPGRDPIMIRSTHKLQQFTLCLASQSLPPWSLKQSRRPLSDCGVLSSKPRPSFCFPSFVSHCQSCPTNDRASFHLLTLATCTLSMVRRSNAKWHDRTTLDKSFSRRRRCSIGLRVWCARTANNKFQTLCSSSPNDSGSLPKDVGAEEKVEDVMPPLLENPPQTPLETATFVLLIFTILCFTTSPFLTLATSSMSLVQPLSLANLEKLSQSCSRLFPFMSLLMVNCMPFQRWLQLFFSMCCPRIFQTSSSWSLSCSKMRSASSSFFSTLGGCRRSPT